MAVMNRTSWIYVGSTALTGGEALKFSSKGKVDLATANTDVPIGFAAEACAAGNVTGQNIGVWTPSACATVQVIASAAISVGAILTVTAGGQMVTCVAKATYVATAQYMWGWAVEAAGAAGDVIEMVWGVSVLSIT